MMNIVLTALAASELAVADLPPVSEVRFAPLPASERAAAPLGPVGPFYPAAAAQARKNGEATIECRAGPAGELKRCKVISEKPAWYDFGVAAVVMAGRKRIFAPGEPTVGEVIRVRVPFVLGSAVEVEP